MVADCPLPETVPDMTVNLDHVLSELDTNIIPNEELGELEYAGD